MLRMAESSLGGAEKGRQVFSSVAGSNTTGVPAGESSGSLTQALHAAEENERALERRLHRVRDRKGLELLRVLRTRIADLKDQLAAESKR